MDQTALPQWFQITQAVVTLGLQIVLAVGAVWLARETKGLRKSTADLFVATQEAAVAQLRPFLIVELAQCESDDAMTTCWKYRCKVSNLTQALARRVQVMIYDKEILKYRKNAGGLSYVGAESSRTVAFHGGEYSCEETIADLTLTQRERELLLKWLSPRPKSFMLGIYRDINGSLYSTSREFSYVQSGDIKYENSLQHFGGEVARASV